MFEVLIFILGLIFGSFYLVVGLRRPLNKSIVKHDSHCDSCKEKLNWYELIPVFSFIIQKGKCRNCNTKIPISTILIELLTGVLFLTGYLLYGLHFEFFVFLIISSLFVIICVSDFKYLIILDGPLIIFSIIYIILSIIYLGIITTLKYAAMGVTMFTIMYLIKILGDILFKRESLGGGDIKFSFVMGLIVGARLGLVALVIASIIALPVALVLSYKNEKEIPYGPFLALALIIVFVFGDYILTFLNTI